MFDPLSICGQPVVCKAGLWIAYTSAMEIPGTAGQQRMKGFLELVTGKELPKQMGPRPFTLAEALARQYPKRSKYGSVKTEYNGRTYDSKLEANFAAELDMSRKATDPKVRPVKIEPQVRFPLKIKGKLICTYVLDFRVTYADKHIEHIDVKGVMTDVYKIKKKMMKVCWGIDILEM